MCVTTTVETVCECENNCADCNECKNKNENKYTDIPNNHVDGGCFQEVYTYTDISNNHENDKCFQEQVYADIPTHHINGECFQMKRNINDK